MKLIPYENITFRSKLSSSELFEKLNDAVDPYWDIFSSTKSQFTGRVLEKSFCISPIVTYKNSFNPELIGVIHPEADGCCIQVKMKLNRWVVIFIYVWIGVVGLTMLFLVYKAIVSGKIEKDIIYPILFSVFPILISWFGYSIEAPTAKSRLKKILEAQEELRNS